MPRRIRGRGCSCCPAMPGGGAWSLRDALEMFVGSEPFERLLLARERPIVRGPRPGRPSPSRGSRSALETRRSWPWRRARARPRRSRPTSARSWAPTAVVLLPRGRRCPYEGISPAPETRPGGPRRAVRRLRAASGPFVLVAPVLAAMQGLIPHARHDARPSSWWPGRELAARRARGAARRPRVPADRPGGAPRGVRGARRRRSTCSPASLGVRSGWSTGATRSRRSASSPVDAAVDDARSAPCAVGAGARADPRRRGARPGGRARAGTPTAFATACSGSPTACTPRGWRRVAPLLFDHLPTPAELLPDGSWVVLTQAERALDRARPAHDEARRSPRPSGGRARACTTLDDGARGPRAAPPLGVHRGLDLRLRSWGSAQGNAAELASRLGEPAASRLPARRDGARPRFARSRRARWSAR